MITRKTVFILGAGASNAYGFPLGSELITNILHDGQIDSVLKEAGISPAVLSSFRTSLWESMPQSIDAFLDSQETPDPGIIEIGKMAIAISLLPLERHENLFRMPDRDGTHPIKDHWFQHLFNQMYDKKRKLWENEVSFVTFNYERSLEYLFLNAVRQRRLVPHEVALDEVRRLRIAHIYGSFGDLYGNDPIPFDGGLDLPRVRRAAESIDTIYETRRQPSDALERATDWLNDSDRVIFLGFGYLGDNLSLLPICGRRDGALPSQSLIGSGYHIDGEARNRLRLQFGIHHVGDASFQCRRFLEHDVSL